MKRKPWDRLKLYSRTSRRGIARDNPKVSPLERQGTRRKPIFLLSLDGELARANRKRLNVKARVYHARDVVESIVNSYPKTPLHAGKTRHSHQTVRLG